MQPGMIFGGIRWFLDEHIKRSWIRKPLYECVVCMSGIWTICIWLLKESEPLSMETTWTIACVGGINFILSPAIEYAIIQLSKIGEEDE